MSSKEPPKDKLGKTVAAFERALRQETHNLHRPPELVWQQLHNRLQWSVYLVELVGLAYEPTAVTTVDPG